MLSDPNPLPKPIGQRRFPRAFHLLKRTLLALRREGLEATAGRIWRFLQRRPPAAVVAALLAHPSYPGKALGGSALKPRVLIIGEMGVPQCRKYRVEQKQELLASLGIASLAVSWHDVAAARDALQLVTHVVFYRVKAEPEIIALIEEARRLGLTTSWEADDLVFDGEATAANPNLLTLPPRHRAAMIADAEKFRSALLRCDQAIASTDTLAAAMRRVTGGEAVVIENALDAETVALARKLRQRARPGDGLIRIVYGSGCDTHDADLELASDALCGLLSRSPDLRLRLIGPLQLPARLAEMTLQIERFPLVPYSDYLALVAACDIAIAPLQDTVFNAAKSNIKYIEAAMLDLPVIASPSPSFAAVIAHGVDGLLAADGEWSTQLTALVTDPVYRRRIGLLGRRNVMRRYRPALIARHQYAGRFAPEVEPPPNRHALIVDLDPRRVAGPSLLPAGEHRQDWRIARLTRLIGIDAPIGTMVRSSIGDVDCFAVRLPRGGPALQQYLRDTFRAVFNTYRPELVVLVGPSVVGDWLRQLCAEAEAVLHSVPASDADDAESGLKLTLAAG